MPPRQRGGGRLCSFVMQRVGEERVGGGGVGGGREVTLAAIRGQPPRSSIFRLDSVLSAGALVLLNTSSGGTRGGLHCGHRAFALHPCGSEVNVR